ncbi:ATP-binding protein [Brevundimonas sp. Leaf280]|uniref:sensor histidine kinase n=1 Tax=Brevundimonas sp. Leaf280 TaxID=1736320 RepID=UPI0009E8FE45|nr:ATP-binding protein [Brevundimonas sp. Leaf280]
MTGPPARREFLGVAGIGVFVVAGLLILIAIIVAGDLARKSAAQDIVRQAEATLLLDQALLSSELDRHRATPVVLASEDIILEALRDPAPATLARVNARLDMLAVQTGAAAIYLLDSQGRAIAANNYRTPVSFVGDDYAYRPYFKTAMRAGSDEYFAFGSRSGRPGLYLSRRVGVGREADGVIVVKIEFDTVEAAWRRQAEQALVTNRDGVIVLSSDPARRFRTLETLDGERAKALRDSRQFGDAPLTPLTPAITPVDDGRVQVGGEIFVPLRRALPVEDWTLLLLVPVADADRAAGPVRWAAGLAGALLMVVLAWVWRAHLRRLDGQRQQAEVRRELELRVDERTTALTAANVKLRNQIEDRKRTEARLRTLQADLVQANRLAHLGQIVAGVAHEINQPVAAIRANADNALTLLSREQPDEAQAKLTRIQGLTERIGAIVEDLRGFARKTPPRTTTVVVDEAVEGALLLVSSRMREDGVAVERTGEARVSAQADRVRLEQVLVNLLQNAFEALGDQADARIGLDVSTTDDLVVIAVTDNGPGLSKATLRTLFTPFSTTKPNGLGLGLVISRDIVEAFGGSLVVASNGRRGARFEVRLRRNPA